MLLPTIWCPWGTSQSQEHKPKHTGCPKTVYLGELVHMHVFSYIHEALHVVEVTSVLGKEEKPLPGTEGLSPPSLVPALACTRSLSSQSVLQSQIPVKAQRWEGRVSVGHQRVRYFLALTGSKKKLLDFCLWTPFDVPEWWKKSSKWEIIETSGRNWKEPLYMVIVDKGLS